MRFINASIFVALLLCGGYALISTAADEPPDENSEQDDEPSLKEREPNWKHLWYGYDRRISQVTLSFAKVNGEQREEIEITVKEPLELKAIEKLLDSPLRPASRQWIYGMGGGLLQETSLGAMYIRAGDEEVTVGITTLGFVLDSAVYDSDRTFFSWGLAKYIDNKMQKALGHGIPADVIDNLTGKCQIKYEKGIYKQLMKELEEQNK